MNYISNKGFFRVILILKSTDINGFNSKKTDDFEFDDSVRFITNKKTEFTYLYHILYEQLNLEMQDCEEEVHSYFEIDAGGYFEFDEIKSLHSVLLLALNIVAKDLVKDILVIHTADSNSRWITVDTESKISNRTSNLFKLLDTMYKFDLSKKEMDKAKNIFPYIKNILLNDNHSSLRNALVYFLNFTKCRFFEDMIINLSIVLESLFSPANQNELSHQISFNISKFLTNEPEKSKKIYDRIKKFYTIRSKVVHGAKEKKINFIGKDVIEAYRILQQVLLKILTSSKMKEVFENDEKRRNYLKNLSFGI